MSYRAWLLVLLCLCSRGAPAAVQVLDDAGQTVRLTQPAQRVVSLSPHITELLFAAGGGQRIVGAVEYSDYPPAALKLPRIGDNRELDLERILAVHPDLLVVWRHGNPERQLQKLRRLGIPIFYSEPQQLEQVASSLERLGVLLGSEAVAADAARQFRQRLQGLRQQNHGQAPVKVFYQVWDKPLMTLNGRHLSSEVLQLCGAVNPFAHLTAAAPQVSIEAVLAAAPEALISAGKAGAPALWVQPWLRYPTLPAVQRRNFITLDVDAISRQTPRVLDAAASLCRQLDDVRRQRPSSAPGKP